jgi:ketosteroid isomerase-like protein
VPLRGRDAFAELVRKSAAAIEPCAFEFANLAVDGDVVLAEWRIAARHRASGTPIEWWGMSVCRIRDGLIESWREYWNPADVAGATRSV